jgi:hypothetical protein
VFAPSTETQARAGLEATANEARALAHAGHDGPELSLVVAWHELQLEHQLTRLRLLLGYGAPALRPERLLEAALDTYANDVARPLERIERVVTVLGPALTARTDAPEETLLSFPHRLARRAGSWPLCALALVEDAAGPARGRRLGRDEWAAERARQSLELVGPGLKYSIERFGLPGRAFEEDAVMRAIVGSPDPAKTFEPESPVGRVDELLREARLQRGRYVNETQLVLDLAAECRPPATPARTGAPT